MSGILSYQILKNFVREKKIYSEDRIESWQFQPNTLDLRLGSIGYRVRSSFLSIKEKVTEKVKDFIMYEIDLSRGAILEKGCVYIIPIKETLDLPQDIHGKTNPKSSTGRLDIFTRIITDRNFRYNVIPKGYSGPLYVEVSPISFTIKVKEGDSLNQIRLIKGENARIDGDELEKYYNNFPLLYHDDGTPVSINDVVFRDGLYMRIDLSYKEANNIIGYKSKKNSSVIDIGKRFSYRTEMFWEKLYSTPDCQMILEPEEFYIFASKERIVVPPGLCGEMVPYDPESGEMRVHYAGFFDTGFGYVEDDIGFKGAKAVLEIRPHDVPFLIEDGQILFRMVFDKNDQIPFHLYGSSLKSNYQCQGLSLSKHFIVD